ncbi:MAG: NAD-dependent epimerase/dehydratase family protein [Dorea sp.]|mgnify:CR=1 FL=1|nr:NAD-dependent epimerase/dehydratase family protein [Dorea sp.]
MKKVLITGANSYIGMSFEKWMTEVHPKEFKIDTVDMKCEKWKEKDFSEYDVVFHVAGIAHADVGHVTEERKNYYHEVNCNLSLETAKTAKEAGIKQFIFMSSMIVYGDSAPLGKKKVIHKETQPSPSNFYGDSKWQADRKIRQLENDDFHVAVLRPPMIYGKGSKGNYPVLAQMAKRLPVFPKVENEKSVLHVDNLSEFVYLLISSGEGGIFFPQNAEYVKTYEMVKEIARCAGHQIWITELLNPLVWIAEKIPGKVSGKIHKAFGSLVYEKNMSNCFKGRYQVRKLNESISLTEKK